MDWTSSDQDEIENSDVKSFIAAVTLYTHKQYVKRRKTVNVKEDSSMDQKFERKQALGRFLDSFRLRRR